MTRTPSAIEKDSKQAGACLREASAYPPICSSSQPPTVAKTATLGALGLPAGDHMVRFHVEADIISFEIAASHPSGEASTGQRQPTGFLKKWGSTARKIEDPADAWLTHINEKHTR